MSININTDINIEFISNFENISAQDWNRLIKSPCPFLRYNFFKSLEKSHSVNFKQGWQPYHLVAKTNDKVTAFMPMYLKSHSWGEYVFDWQWAEAFKRYNMNYYPKLVATIPFTPVASDKLHSSQFELNDIFGSLTEHCQQENINSWHILYCNRIETTVPTDVYQRNTVQFHWFNKNYETFSDFLNTFTSRKRKNTYKERKSIIEQGIKVRQLKNSDISQQDIDFFYLTYQLTYLKRGHQPHLTIEFFKKLLTSMSDTLLLVIANNGQEDIACALFFYDEHQLYGRYWGCTKQYKNLHFELCYYQGIEFCIQNKLRCFNPGTQGEHKIQRGFEPILTHSYHWIKHPSFKDPIKNFCQQEQEHMLTYQQQCRQLLPFKNTMNSL